QRRPLTPVPAEQSYQRAEQGQPAEEQGACQQPGGEVAPLDLIGVVVGDVAQQGAEKQRKTAGEQQSVQGVQWSGVIRIYSWGHGSVSCTRERRAAGQAGLPLPVGGGNPGGPAACLSQCSSAGRGGQRSGSGLRPSRAAGCRCADELRSPAIPGSVSPRPGHTSP